MKKKIILSILLFSSGFLTHAFFFPEFLANGVWSVAEIVVPNPTPANSDQANDPLMTKITFDGKKFSKHNITIGFTRYIQIVNTNEDELMSLFSNTPELTTPRGYGYLEAVQKQFNQKGQFVVADKDNPDEKLVITVK